MRQFSLAVVSTWVLTCAVLGAAEFWESKPFTAWSDAEVKKLLADSPWAGKGTLTHTRPGGGARPIEDTVLVTWISALAVRQANVREATGQNGAVTPDHQALLAQAPPYYVIALKVQGGSAMGVRNVEPLAKQTFLRREGKPDLALVQAESHMLDKEGNIVPAPQRGGPPAPGGRGAPGAGGFGGGFGGGAASALVVLAFPRTDGIALDDKEVELVSRIGQYNLKKKFKLKDMVLNGELSL